MDCQTINHLIDRARQAYLRRKEYDGRAPRLADCDIINRRGRDFILLRDGDELIATYGIRKSGDLRFLPDGEYERSDTHHLQRSSNESL